MLSYLQRPQRLLQCFSDAVLFKQLQLQQLQMLFLRQLLELEHVRLLIVPELVRGAQSHLFEHQLPRRSWKRSPPRFAERLLARRGASRV